MTTLTYKDLSLPPIKDFNYKNYDKVTLSSIFRTGAVFVAVVTPVTSPKALGDQRPYAQFTTSAGNKTRP
jgi:hypothetical protein